jgi:hypothetical protein
MDSALAHKLAGLEFDERLVGAMREAGDGSAGAAMAGPLDTLKGAIEELASAQRLVDQLALRIAGPAKAAGAGNTWLPPGREAEVTFLGQVEQLAGRVSTLSHEIRDAVAHVGRRLDGAPG